MATDNKGVMVYLPPELEEVLEKYCTENKITRKNKDGEPVASMGTGIVHYLKSHLLGIAPSNLLTGAGALLTRDDVLLLIRESQTSSSVGDGLSIDRVTEIARNEVELAASRFITRDDAQRMIDEALGMIQAAGLGAEEEEEPEFDGWPINHFSEENNLGVTNKSGAAAINAALVAAGLADDYKYKSSCRKIYPIEPGQ